MSLAKDGNASTGSATGDWWVRALNGIEALAEYDARTFNVGLRYSCWKERIHLIVECNDLGNLFSAGKAFWSGGVYVTIPLVDKESHHVRGDYRIGKGECRPSWTE